MRTLVTILVALALAPVATAAPVARLDNPLDGECVGSSHYPVRGKATWTGTNGDGSFWHYKLFRSTGGIPIQESAGSSPSDGGFYTPLTTLDTLNLPEDRFISELTVYEKESNTYVYAQREFQPVYDRVNPTAPDVVTQLAASGRQVWFSVSQSADMGCSGGIDGYNSVAVFPGGSVFGVGIGRNVITPPMLQADTNYTLKSYATDRVGLESSYGRNYVSRTANHYDTVYAGRVTKAGQPQTGVRVTATSASLATATAQTNGDGRYSIALPGQGSSWTIQWETGCGLSICGSIPTVTRQRTTPYEAGLLRVENVVLP